VVHSTAQRTARPTVDHVESVGASDLFLSLQNQLASLAKTNRPVLLIGERGTGKELAAARLHYLSPRWSGPFIKLNCASLSPSLLESELFGHEAGAFTGANRLRKGRFETADGGTLFLDELSQMPLEVQEKILRAIEYQTFERVGGESPIHADVRVVSATNCDLRDLVLTGKFKADLLDRLAFQVVYLPPLRLRTGDVELLAQYFARSFALELGREQVPVLSTNALEALQAHSWPGNVRELRNVVERAVYSCEEGEIGEIVLDPFTSPFEVRLEPAGKPQPMTPENSAPESRTSSAEEKSVRLPLDFHAEVAKCEINLLQEALRQARYQQQSAAKLLGLSYDQFRGLYRKYRELVDAKCES
jgi:psp operon transcriptional activator